MSEAEATRAATLRAALDSYEAGHSNRDVQMTTFVELLRGGAQLFGYRVELTWPDGSPYGKTNAELADWVEQLRTVTRKEQV
jgi:hypothetical protein